MNGLYLLHVNRSINSMIATDTAKHHAEIPTMSKMLKKALFEGLKVFNWYIIYIWSCNKLLPRGDSLACASFCVA